MTTTAIPPSGSTLSGLTWLAIALVVVGAINWGLVGIFKLDLVAAIVRPSVPGEPHRLRPRRARGAVPPRHMAFGRLREVRASPPAARPRRPPRGARSWERPGAVWTARDVHTPCAPAR